MGVYIMSKALRIARRSRLSVLLSLGLIAAVVLALVPLGGPTPGKAAFPGVNGKIAFVSDRDEPGNWDIYVMNPDGTSVARLTTDPGGEFDPAWSPDGSKIVFRCDSRICVVNADGSGRTAVTTSGGQQPAWSPDGSKIAFTDGDILVINADGTGVTNLTNSPEFESSPAWSPDGSKIAFTSVSGGNGGIYVMNADGTGRAVVFDSPGFDSRPTWSPDGTRIAFNSGSNSIGIVNADGSGLATLLNTGPSTGKLDWSPDGTKFVFDGSESLANIGNIDIWLINADDATGTTKIKLTNYPGSDNSPAWQSVVPATPTPSPTPTPAAITTLTGAASAGATQLLTAGSEGFSVRDLVTISPGGPNEESNVIAGFGSVDLAAPLLFAHLPGELVVKIASFVQPGDADCDGQVTAVDALFVLRRVAGLLPLSPCWAAGNVRCLDDIDATDALFILREVAALGVNLPPGCPAIGVP